MKFRFTRVKKGGWFDNGIPFGEPFNWTELWETPHRYYGILTYIKRCILGTWPPWWN